MTPVHLPKDGCPIQNGSQGWDAKYDPLNAESAVLQHGYCLYSDNVGYVNFPMSPDGVFDGLQPK